MRDKDVIYREQLLKRQGARASTAIDQDVVIDKQRSGPIVGTTDSPATAENPNIH